MFCATSFHALVKLSVADLILSVSFVDKASSTFFISPSILLFASAGTLSLSSSKGNDKNVEDASYEVVDDDKDK